MANERSFEESIIGCTIRMRGISARELSIKNLTDVYSLLRFMIFRLESPLPRDVILKGIERILLLGLTPEAIILAIENESLHPHETMKHLTMYLSDHYLLQQYPLSELLRDVFLDYLEWRKNEF